MRDFLTAIATLFTLALIALMVGPHFVDWNARREQLAEVISTRSGIPMRMNGALRVTLLPTPSLDVEAIEFGPADAPLARAGRLTVSLSTMALLSGRIQVTNARADRPEISRVALTLPASSEAALFRSAAAGQFGIEHLDLRGLRIVERIGAGAASEPGFLDVTIAAPNFAGPFRVDATDGPRGREYHLQIGRLEGGRARMKGLIEDKNLGSRLTLDGWFALPGVAEQPIFDGSAIANGNPLIDGPQGPQLAFQMAARVVASRDQIIADPVNLSLGTGESALQLAGKALIDLSGERPTAEVRLGAKRFDAAALTTPDAGGRRPVDQRLISGLLAGGRFSELPLDMALDLSVGAVQLEGAQAQEMALGASIRAGTLGINTLGFLLPGGTRVEYRRDRLALPAAFDGRLEVEAGDLPSLVTWLRGPDAAINLPPSARFAAEVAGGPGGFAFRGISLESPAGTLSGSGELLPAEAGRRVLPRLQLTLGAERFDARVLAALDPLRTIPGIEFSTRLDVRRLVVDGQVLGGLQVALDRDGASTSLRQLRLLGSRGEEVTLSGTLSTKALQLAGKLDAERLGDITRLAGTLFPGPFSDALAARASVLEPAIAVANIRMASEPGGAIWDITAEGKLGGTVISGKSQSALRSGEIAVTLEGDLANSDGGRLLSQLTGLAMPASAAGKLKFKAEGNPRQAVKASAEGVLGGLDLTFDGDFGLLRANPLDGRLVIRSGDLAGFGRLLGGAAGLARVQTPALIQGRLLSDQAKLTLTGMNARIGEEALTGEVSLDLARGGQMAGQIRMGTISLPALFAPVLGENWPDAKAGWARTSFAAPIPPPVSGDLWIEAREGRLGDGTVLGSPHFVWRFSQNGMAIEGFGAALGDARLTGNATMLRKADRVDLAGRIEVLRLPLGYLAGRLSGEIPFSGSGSTPLELVSSLAGAGRLALDDVVIPAADPRALARITAASLDALQPINDNHIGGLIDQELRKGDFRINAASWPASLLNGQMRLGGVPLAAGQGDTGGISVTPSLSLDLPRREAEFRLSFVQPSLPKDWRGAVPDITLGLQLRHDGPPGLRRNLQVSSLVNGFLAMAIQRDLERAEAFDADVREREAQLRRQKGDGFMLRRESEIRLFEVLVEAEAEANKRRAEAEETRRRLEQEAELAARTRARLAEEKLKAQPAAPATSAPLEIAPRVPPNSTGQPVPPG